MNKVKTLLVVLFSSVLMITGCIDININDKSKDTTVNNENSIDKEVDKDNDENKDNETSNMKQVSLNISSLDANSGEKIVLGSLKLDEDKSLEEKLNILIEEISKIQFNNTPIKLVKIEDNVAYIDLQEDDNKNYWSTVYFQGSTGANITTYTLTESILQRDYKGNWINGVFFSYEGKTDMEFDHIGMDFFGTVISR